MKTLMLAYIFHSRESKVNSDYNLNIASNTVALLAMDMSDNSVSVLGSVLLPADNSSNDFTIEVSDFEESGNTLTVSFSSSGLSVSTSSNVNSSIVFDADFAKLVSGNDNFSIYNGGAK